MKNLKRWIAAYEEMDQPSREDCLDMAERRAIKRPGRVRAQLTLVANNGIARIRDCLGTHRLQVVHNILAPPLVQSVVKLK